MDVCIHPGGQGSLEGLRASEDYLIHLPDFRNQKARISFLFQLLIVGLYSKL